jgi:hypothetical protein
MCSYAFPQPPNANQAAVSAHRAWTNALGLNPLMAHFLATTNSARTLRAPTGVIVVMIVVRVAPMASAA